MARAKKEKGGSKSSAGLKTSRRKFKRATKEERLAVKAGRNKIAPAHLLFWRSLEVLWRHRKLLGGILVVYALLDLLLVGAGIGNVGAAKTTLAQISHGHVDKISGGVALFAFLISSTSGSASGAAAGAYQTMLLLLISVVLIWALRQIYAEHPARVREAFYVGPYPIVPFILVLLIIGLQLLPLVIGGGLYSSLVGGGITAGAGEHLVALAIFLLLVSWSLFMVCASVFALYIVTLPDMTPLQALRSAREMARFRRWIILRKLLFLPLALLVLAAMIVIPFALFVTPLATTIFFALTVLAVGVAHSYVYALYRELL